MFVSCIVLGSTVAVVAEIEEAKFDGKHGLPPSVQTSKGTKLYVGGSGPGNFSTIQSAINAASNGDTIIVYAGTYYESQIVIDKSLIVQGAGSSSSIIDGNGATLSSTGLVKIIANGDVTFSGFTVKDAGGPTGYGAGDNKMNMAITACASSSGVTYTITSNRIIGTNDPDDDYDWGFYATSGGKENIIFTHNIVTQTGCNNIVVEKTIGFTDISFNTLDAGCWGIDSIYYMTCQGTDITTPQKITNNTINVGTGVNPGGANYNKVTAIGFSSAYLGCTGEADTGKYTNILISGNTITNVKEWRRGIALDNFAWGDGTGGEISNAIITKNVITAISSSPVSFAIRLSGLVTNTIIKENQIKNCDMSFWGRTGYYGSSTAFPAGTQMNGNSFQNNAGGVVWEGPTLLNARLNWWGSLHVEDPIDGSVDYSPWLGAPYGTTPMTICTDDIIGEAINITTAGETVFVCKGTYNEHLTISKRISVIGEDCNTTIIDGLSLGKIISITTDDVTLKGFTLQNCGVYKDDAGIYIGSDGNTIQGNILKENTEGILLWNAAANKITQNTFTNCDYAIYLESSATNMIEDNIIVQNDQGIEVESSSDNDINGNQIMENKVGIRLQSDSSDNKIQYNKIASNTERGVYLKDLGDKTNDIYHNNFIDNKVNAYFESTIRSRWESNYWDDWIGVIIPQFSMFPKIILGRFFSVVPWVNIDRNPASVPYPT